MATAAEALSIELIYDADCPNVALARSTLSEAFARTGMNAGWREWERSSSNVPAYVKAFGSPTILVDGKDVAGEAPDASGRNCRVYRTKDGALTPTPSLEAVCTAISAPNVLVARPNRVRTFGASLPVVATALLPKLTCPLCWPAYTAVLGALGLEFVDYTPYLFPATAVFLAVAIGALIFAARRTGRYIPLALGVIAGAVVLAGKFAVDADWVTNIGIAFLMGAIFLSARKRTHSASCQDCVSSGDKIRSA